MSTPLQRYDQSQWNGPYIVLPFPTMLSSNPALNSKRVNHTMPFDERSYVVWLIRASGILRKWHASFVAYVSTILVQNLEHIHSLNDFFLSHSSTQIAILIMGLDHGIGDCNLYGIWVEECDDYSPQFHNLKNTIILECPSFEMRDDRQCSRLQSQILR